MPSVSAIGELGHRRWAYSRHWRSWAWRRSSFSQFLVTVLGGFLRSALGSQKVSLPILDAPLDCLAIGKPFVQHLPRQAGQFVVSRKTQRDQLRNGGLRDSRAQVRRQQALEPQTHFQTNQTILNGKREKPRIQKGNHERRAEHHAHDGRKVNSGLQPNDAPYESDG